MTLGKKSRSMKPLLLLLAISFGLPAAAQTTEHPLIYQLATTADVIAVARMRDPQIWIGSELIVETAHSTALVERTLKGEKLPLKITIQIVRHLNLESMALERPQEPNQNSVSAFPITPTSTSKYITVDDTDQLKDAAQVIVFLRRAKDGTLSAVDGFLFTLPYTRELEGVVSSAAKNQAGHGNPL